MSAHCRGFQAAMCHWALDTHCTLRTDSCRKRAFERGHFPSLSSLPCTVSVSSSLLLGICPWGRFFQRFFLCFSFSVSRSVLFCLFLSVSFCFCLSIFLSQSNACNFLYHICMVPLLFSFFLLPSHAKRSHCDLGDNACDIESVMRVPRHIYDVRAELT